MRRPPKVTRVSKATRGKIIKAASRAFALGGYEGASIRTIVAEADVNQAAINYHFGSKEGLYRAVLQAAVRALMVDSDATESPGTLSRKTALQSFMRGQLRPMTARDELSDYVRIFNWETLKPSPVFRQFMAKEAAPFLAGASLARRFLPEDATDEQAVIGALWLFGQCSIFVRNAEQLAKAPFRLEIDEQFVDRLADTIADWAANGLGRLPTKARP